MSRIKDPPADDPNANASWQRMIDVMRAQMPGPKTHSVWTAVDWGSETLTDAEREAAAHRRAAARALDRGDVKRANGHCKAAEILETTEDE